MDGYGQKHSGYIAHWPKKRTLDIGLVTGQLPLQKPCQQRPGNQSGSVTGIEPSEPGKLKVALFQWAGLRLMLQTQGGVRAVGLGMHSVRRKCRHLLNGNPSCEVLEPRPSFYPLYTLNRDRIPIFKGHKEILE